MSLDRDQMGFFSAKDFEAASLNHVMLMASLQECATAIRRVDKMIENDLEEHFQAWVPMSSSVVKYKEGIHFPIVSEILRTVKDNEELKYNLRVKKQKFIEEARRTNAEDFSEEYDDEPN